jgi:cardiolipin synthase
MHWTVIFTTAFATLALTIIVLNLKSPGRRIEHKIKSHGPLDCPEVMRSVGEILGPPLTKGNSILALHNGDKIFPAMLEAIRSARKTITFETYVYWSGEIGKEIALALIDRAKNGVRVHVLLDWLGTRTMDTNLLTEMRDAGITVERYHPLRWYNLMRINNRTHRKILVVDGKIGFTGGVGIADQWTGNAQDENHWRDSHFRVEGPAVAQLQAAFLDNWNATDSEVLHGNDYFPELRPAGESIAQVFKSSPAEGSSSARLMYLYTIAHAQKSIRIANAYFVPDSHLRRLILEARARGVEVEVIVPGAKMNSALTRFASKKVWGDLLACGARIFEYQPTMFHCKYMVVDDAWVSVGSTNLDNRSFRLNAECNLNVIDKNFAREMLATFERDKSLSRETSYSQWQQRPLLEKTLDWISSLARSQV